MSDGLPSDDQVRRIEHGVMDRIDARRATRNRVIGSITAIVLVGGGFGLVLNGVRGVSGSSTSGAGTSTADKGMDTVAVRCALGAGSDSNGTRLVKVPEASLPQGAVAACTGTRNDFQSTEGRAPTKDDGTPAASAASPSAIPRGVLCTDFDGSLVVLSPKGTASATCVKAGMEPYER